MAVADWKFLLAGTTAGSISGELSTARNRHLTFALSGPAQVSFDMPGDHPQARLIDELAADLFVERAGEMLFKGRIGASTDKLAGGDHTSSFTAIDYRGMLDRRITWAASTLSFTNEEQAEIAWQLIADSQSLSDLGIWRVGQDSIDTLVPTGITRTMTFPTGQKIGEAIGSIGQQQNGFDWDISGNGQFRLFYPRRDRYASGGSPTLAYGREILEADRTIASTTFANALFYTGAQGLAPVEVVASDTSTYGRFESAIARPDLKDQASVSAAAGYELAVDDSLQPAYTLIMAPGYWSPDLYWLGDSIEVFVSGGRLAVDQVMRITGIDIALDDAGAEVVSLTFTQPPAALSNAAGAGGGSGAIGSASALGSPGVVASPFSLANTLGNLSSGLGNLERNTGQLSGAMGPPGPEGPGPTATGYIVGTQGAGSGGTPITVPPNSQGGFTWDPSTTHPPSMGSNVSIGSGPSVPVTGMVWIVRAVVEMHEAPWTDPFTVWLTWFDDDPAALWDPSMTGPTAGWAVPAALNPHDLHMWGKLTTVVLNTNTTVKTLFGLGVLNQSANPHNYTGWLDMASLNNAWAYS